ncbi:MAG: MBL fold metallo-hydrolase [Planctomycetes bacterium]|nr:MBL fold metallo-hydrolase [Planctomycetota bacterium]
MLTIHEIPVTPFQQNSTLWICEETGQAAACDVGDAQPILDAVEKLGCTLEKIVATHGHLDHIGGTFELLEATGLEFWFPMGDDWLRKEITNQSLMYGWRELQIPEVHHELNHGDLVQVGAQKLEVRHCPGHTPGHVVFYHQESSQLVAGDVLFQGSVGRTDFPRGSWEDLQQSIRTQVYSLPPDTLVHCGHGPTTTVGHEAATNPFVRALT